MVNIKMAKKTFYYKFLIKLNRKLSISEIKSIKKAIQRCLLDVPIIDIHGGIANNNGYHKFKRETDKVGNQI